MEEDNVGESKLCVLCRREVDVRDKRKKKQQTTSTLSLFLFFWPLLLLSPAILVRLRLCRLTFLASTFLRAHLSGGGGRDLRAVLRAGCEERQAALPALRLRCVDARDLLQRRVSARSPRPAKTLTDAHKQSAGSTTDKQRLPPGRLFPQWAHRDLANVSKGVKRGIATVRLRSRC